MTTQLSAVRCDGGHYNCSPPMECCKQGCCFLLTPSIYRPPSMQSGSFFNPLFLGHWYFWLAVTATVAGILCACSLWRRHSQGGGLCCSDSNGRDERASEPDSNGSFYAPPQYSRCNSFHQAPPPYSEVTSKPDLYPLVISYNNEPVIKSNNASTGYLMVQYFRNFIVRPVGTLSATSTVDSLSSSYLCNAVNEANTIVPPAYSHVGSLEEVPNDVLTQSNPTPSPPRRFPRSISCLSACRATEYHQVLQRSPSAHTQLLNTPVTQPGGDVTQLGDNVVRAGNDVGDGVAQLGDDVTRAVGGGPVACVPHFSSMQGNSGVTQQGRSGKMGESPKHTVVQIRDNPFFVGQDGTTNGGVSAGNRTGVEAVLGGPEARPQTSFEASTSHTYKARKMSRQRALKERSQDSTEDEDNFSDLLNLSVCLPSVVSHYEHPVHSTPHLQDLSYCVTNSMTGSDISSLANLGTPDSPPRATSPTVEMKELLDKIQQLPQQQKCSVQAVHIPITDSKTAVGCFRKIRAKTLYMPLNETVASGKAKNVFSRNWLSRSAPCTPSGNFVPNFPTSKGSQKGSKSKLTDGSPLLREHAEESEDEPQNNGFL